MRDNNDLQLYAFNTSIKGGFTIGTRVVLSTVRAVSVAQWYGSAKWDAMTLYGVCQSFLPADATYLSGGKGIYVYGTNAVADKDQVVLTTEANGCTIE